jgi:hypothetical protein
MDAESFQTVRDSNCTIFGVVKRQNFVFCLLNQDAEPDGQICTNHVHEAETGNYFVTVNFYLLKWKYGQLV